MQKQSDWLMNEEAVLQNPELGQVFCKYFANNLGGVVVVVVVVVVVSLTCKTGVGVLLNPYKYDLETEVGRH